jgi:hypothetical protein
MAFTVQNPNPPNSQLITRGKPTNLGTLGANNQAVQFFVSNLRDAPNGTDALTITVNPTGALAGGTFQLEGSIDGGLSWFSIIPSAAAAGTNNSTAIIGITAPVPADTAAIAAFCYNITGLSGATIFRFGLTAFTSGSGAVWAYTP